MKEAKDNVNEWMCLYSSKTLFTKTGGKQIWPGDYGLLIPDNSLFAIICILKIRRWKLIVRRRPMSSLLISYICGFSVAKSCPTVCNPMDSSMPGSLVLHYLPEFAQIHVLELAIYLTISSSAVPLLLLPSIFPSIGIISNELAFCIRWPKYWSFSFSNSSSMNIQD